MIVYTKCEECKRWVEESSMDYFTEIGNVCQKCSLRLIKESDKGEKQ